MTRASPNDRNAEAEYLTDEDYRTYWFKLEGLRNRISEDLKLEPEMNILDVGTGHGLFALEMAKQLENGNVVGIDVVDDGTRTARKLAKRARLTNLMSVVKADAVSLPFQDSCFDLAASFLGMRDIHMTRGKRGVRKAVEEMIRVVKQTSRIVLCVTPPEEMETEDQKTAVALEGEVFGAKSLPKGFYSSIFKANNVTLTGSEAYFTRKKMTAAQTEVEIKDGIEIARRIYCRRVPAFGEVWRRFGKSIETYGYGMYSKVVAIIGRKLIR